ncbi:MAG: hypothetical protein H0V47_12980 [Chloroflexia bacterium]|jgi:hypothetical protein|nr:hypothetical protein [Chloroflexia bacterium]
MAQLQVQLSDDQLEELRRYGSQQQIPISELIESYVNYLLAGGPPVPMSMDDVPSGAELAAIATYGKAFDWLADEPDLYSLEDGEPV